MAYYLTIDQGNTATKVALWRDDELIELAIEPAMTQRLLRRLTAPAGGRADCALMCSVAKADPHADELMRRFADRVMHVSATMPLPIRIDYGTPGTLGVDRIAAAVGARTLFPGRPLLVVDAGTAVTYDAVTADGVFAGGNIAPGISMRLQALHRYTARLPLLAPPRDLEPGRVFGHDTASAMILGAVYGIVGSIAYYRKSFHADADPTVVVTGGWARMLADFCDFEVAVDPDLASKGLNSILLYNEHITPQLKQH